MIKLPDPIFRAYFQNSTDADIAGGYPYAYTEGNQTYYDTSFGDGILVGTNDVVKYKSQGNLPLFNQAGAIEFRIRTKSLFGSGGMRYYFYNGDGIHNNCFRIYHDATGILIWNTRAAGVNQIYIAEPLTWKTNEEHHVVLTWDFINQQAYFCVDTVELGSSLSFGTVPQAKYFHVGSKAPKGDAADDAITDLRIYDEFFDEDKREIIFLRKDASYRLSYRLGELFPPFNDRKIDRCWGIVP